MDERSSKKRSNRVAVEETRRYHFDSSFGNKRCYFSHLLSYGECRTTDSLMTLPKSFEKFPTKKFILKFIIGLSFNNYLGLD